MSEHCGKSQQGSMQLHRLVNEEQIQSRVAELAGQISCDYEGRELTIIAVMKGAIFFLVDLLRCLRMPVRLEVVHVASYAGTASSGTVHVLSEISVDIRGRHVLVVDDILDSGLTLSFVVREIQRHSPASVQTCVLLRKQVQRSIPVDADYCGFDIDGEFVVGYGLDYNDLYRNLPYIAELRRPPFNRQSPAEHP